MKYSLLLLLFGCYHTQYSSTPVEADIKGPTVVGWINDNQVLYSCEQQNVNPALVWVACDFVNNAGRTSFRCFYQSS